MTFYKTSNLLLYTMSIAYMGLHTRAPGQFDMCLYRDNSSQHLQLIST